MIECKKALISQCFFRFAKKDIFYEIVVNLICDLLDWRVCVSEIIATNEQEVLIQHMVDRLPALRKKYGISQKELGEKIGLSRQTISAIERKTTPLTWTSMLAMLMFFTANCNCVFYFPQRTEFADAEILQSLLAINGSRKKKEKIL